MIPYVCRQAARLYVTGGLGGGVFNFLGDSDVLVWLNVMSVWIRTF